MNVAVDTGRLPQIRDFEDPSFDPFAMEVFNNGDALDPHSVWAQMRQAGGDVHPVGNHEMFTGTTIDLYGGAPRYTILGYDTVSRVFLDPDSFLNAGNMLTIGRTFGNTLPVMDKPEHPRFRKIFQKVFMPTVVAKWGESVVDPVVGELVSRFEGRGQAELVEDFTHHFPFRIIYRQLGLSDEVAAIFHKLVVAQVLIRHAPSREKVAEACGKLGVFFGELIAQRREQPGEDLVSYLAAAEVDGEYLPEDVLISFLRLIIHAGGDTTFRGTSNLLAGLLSHPEQLEAVRNNRELIGPAIEEAMRWEGPVTVMARSTAQDVELAGVTIPAGAHLDVGIMSANRDPAKFDDPHSFNIFREKQARPIAFSTGPHVCIGQHLARVEMRRAVNALLDRLPNLRLDPDKPAPEIRGHSLRRPEHLHVLFDA